MQERKELPLRSGDTVRVWVKVVEKGKTRLQAFEGTVISRKGGTTAGATFTVRRTTDKYGVEKIFPLYSPVIDKIEILRHVKTRRAKLYHIREKAAREIRRQMRRMQFVNISTGGNVEEPEVTTETQTEETPDVTTEIQTKEIPDVITEVTIEAKE
jgi:large subunit ribosomal protein L19